jgi:hypothetical protein
MAEYGGKRKMKQTVRGQIDNPNQMEFELLSLLSYYCCTGHTL